MKINPRQLEKMAKRMGIETKTVDATEVIIRTPDRDIIISNPSVSRVNMMGQDSFQISGDVSERSPNAEAEKFTDDDVKMVASQSGSSEGEARSALEETGGDIAEAILSLKK